MTTITKAAQQAIDALEQALPELCIEHMSDAKGAIKALRAALQDKAVEASFSGWVEVVGNAPPKLDWSDSAATKTNAPEGASELAAARGESSVNTGLGLASLDSTCSHVFALDPRGGIRICNRCGTVERRRAAQPAPVVPDDVALLDWLKDNLFTHRWNGVVGPGCAVHWHVAPDFRHKQADLIDSSGPGGDFRAAIKAAMIAASQQQGGQHG